MDPNLSTSSGPFTSPSGNNFPMPGAGGSSGAGSGPLPIIIMVILGLGALVFAGLAVTFYGQASNATSTLTAQKAAASAAAVTSQKKLDSDAYTLAGESPFRSYIAPQSFGGFEIKFPKDWSGYVDQETFGTQVSLILNPDFVQHINGLDIAAAARVMLIETPSAQYLQNLAGQVQNGTLKQANITVSDQPGFDFTGTFSDQKTSREVVIPVRDKVLVFTNEDKKYASEFNEILAQAHIIP